MSLPPALPAPQDPARPERVPTPGGRAGTGPRGGTARAGSTDGNELQDLTQDWAPWSWAQETVRGPHRVDGGRGQAGARSDVPPRPLRLCPPNTHPHRGLSVSKYETQVHEWYVRTYRISRVSDVHWGEQPGGSVCLFREKQQHRLRSPAQRVWASRIFPLWSPRCRARWMTGHVPGLGSVPTRRE